jgi:hypothetical protein
MARKILTIGITINLENYENLRLEVQGEVGDDGNTEGLVSFLDGMLARLGHGDQATAERVEAYRRRVLASPGSAVVAAVPDWKAEAGTSEPRPTPGTVQPEPASRPPEPVPGPREPSPAEARQEIAPAKEAQPVTGKASVEGRVVKPAAKAPARTEEPASPAAAPPPARKTEPRKAPAPPPPKEAVKEAVKAPAQPERPVIAEGEVACEGCGASITRNQEKLSRLLTGKSLCKKCMNP